MRGAVWFVVAAGLAWSVSPSAHAEDRPLLVVVESAPREAGAIRRSIAEATGARVVALSDDDAPRSAATLSVALSSDRRSAWLCYRNDDRLRYERLSAPADAARGLGWLASAAAALVRRAETDRADWSIADEVIDPFANEPRRARPMDMRLPPEILDPWERPRSTGRWERSTESGASLSPPSPRR